MERDLATDMQLPCSRGSPWLVVGALFGDLGIGAGMGHLTVFAWGHACWKLMLPHVFFILLYCLYVFMQLCHLELHRPTHRFGQRLRHVVFTVFTTCSLCAMLEVFMVNTWQVFAFGAVTTARCPECATVVNDREIFCRKLDLALSSLQSPACQHKDS